MGLKTTQLHATADPLRAHSAPGDNAWFIVAWAPIGGLPPSQSTGLGRLS